MRRRVLIVDDEPQTCELIQRIVGSVGMEAQIVNNSSRAPDFLGTAKFDLIFLDFHMPYPDGVELARQVRKSRSNRTTTVVLVSDDQRPSALSVGFEAGANFFLYKPIDKDKLIKLVKATQGMIEHERRRLRRIPVRQRVKIRFGAEDLEGETVDISLSGMLVKAHRTFPPGTSVQLSLHLPKNARPVTGVGCVVRTTGTNEMGIHMDRLSAAETERLQEFLLPLISKGT